MEGGSVKGGCASAEPVDKPESIRTLFTLTLGCCSSHQREESEGEQLHFALAEGESGKGESERWKRWREGE